MALVGRPDVLRLRRNVALLREVVPWRDVRLLREVLALRADVLSLRAGVLTL